MAERIRTAANAAALAAAAATPALPLRFVTRSWSRATIAKPVKPYALPN
ncbi:hypothetical protein KIP88_04940 [Bradyrhizobium sp. SRL28]|nr:hypothetical protein [Bradyrhizobium sp. SRL28]MBT1509841.1 hypothetical protein [Bradyrhizobium sp. SRL28]